LVTSLRGYVESLGVAFPASRSGKLKMILQSFCGGALLLYLANENWFNPWARNAFVGLVWLTVFVTVMSGVVYIQRARSILKEYVLSGDKLLAEKSALGDSEPLG